jgi:hypothetical protein
MDKSIYPEDDGGQGWHHEQELYQQYLLEMQQYRLLDVNTKGKSMSYFIRDLGLDKQFELPPAGSHLARCFRFIDLGTQKFTTSGETKEAEQCVLSWELSKQMSDGRPYTITERYTKNLNEKAKLGQALISWRTKPFSREERNDGWDIRAILGRACLLTIVHTQKGARTFAGVTSVVPVPDGLTPPQLTNDVLGFVFSEWTEEKFSKVPRYYQEIIKKSPEYERIVSGVVTSHHDIDDDIPF